MRFPSLSHLSKKSLGELLRDLFARHRALTAEVLHALAEADRRRLWAEDGYPSMYAWCMAEFGLSEDMAARRICAARQSRRYPRILEMVTDGRLHLSGILVLAPKLKEAPERAEELLAAAAHKSRRHIEHMLAERFPQADVTTTLTPLPAPARGEVAGGSGSRLAVASETSPAPWRVEVAVAGGVRPAETSESSPAPARVTTAPACSRIAPLSPQRYGVQFTMDEAMHADLIRAQELLGPQAGEDRVRDVFRRALRDLVTGLEKRKFAATDRPRQQSRKAAGGRHIPAGVKREVRTRDQDRCTFVAGNGKRCDSRTSLEYDHVTPIAKGGRSTAGNVRLLCRAHNQREAEREFGEGFMHEIRERARRVVPPGAPQRGTVSRAMAAPSQGSAGPHAPPAPG